MIVKQKFGLLLNQAFQRASMSSLSLAIGAQKFFVKFDERAHRDTGYRKPRARYYLTEYRMLNRCRKNTAAFLTGITEPTLY